MVNTILSGHISPETAYSVVNYPYGFRLKCTIRYWLEYKPGHGVRLMSQTTNPKKAGWVWNKPKGSTYCKFGGCMYLDSEQHVHWSGLTEYTNGIEAAAWVSAYGDGNHPECVSLADKWMKAKLLFDAKLASGEIKITVGVR